MRNNQLGSQAISKVKNLIFVAIAGFALGSCGSGTSTTTGAGGTNSGGTTGTGGQGQGGGGAGGSAAAGGVSGKGGGGTVGATGGVSSSGGAPASGGAQTTGGGLGSGGVAATGGATSRDAGVRDLGAGGAGTGGVVATGGTAIDAAPLGGDWPPSANFTNPITWQDIPDPEVIRVDDVYYYTASNMHYVPGGPILRSWDLVNWEFVGHGVPVYDYSTKYDLNNGQAYIKGTWASSLAYRKSSKTFHWLGCIEFGKTYMYSAPAPQGPWTKKATINNCYYDCGMLVDYDNSTDETMYVAYGGSGNISVAQLGPDWTTQVKTQQVYTTNGSYTLEGSHFFRYKGYYYITPTRPADAEFVLRASDPFGPYTIKTLVDKVKGPVASGGAPHQGSFIQTTGGDWYYMAFQDAYPGGRIPVMAPVTWTADGWPQVTLANGAWGTSYPYPKVTKPPQATKPHTGKETFAGTELGPEWEWNHNPDNSKWSIDDGVTLQTATVTNDIFRARNTLTHRVLGPQSTGTVELDVTNMKDGDVAGLALFRQTTAYVAVKKSGGTSKISLVTGATLGTSDWNTTSTGTESATATFSGTTVWFLASIDVNPGSGKQGKFSYSTDGTTFTAIGSGFTLNNSWEFYPGYRFGILNFATTALGGSVKVKSFTLTTP
jgi:beta-xylosidase